MQENVEEEGWTILFENKDSKGRNIVTASGNGTINDCVNCLQNEDPGNVYFVRDVTCGQGGLITVELEERNLEGDFEWEPCHGKFGGWMDSSQVGAFGPKVPKVFKKVRGYKVNCKLTRQRRLNGADREYHVLIEILPKKSFSKKIGKKVSEFEKLQENKEDESKSGKISKVFSKWGEKLKELVRRDKKVSESKKTIKEEKVSEPENPLADLLNSIE